jgi:archaellum component FlaD/FlaE
VFHKFCENLLLRFVAFPQTLETRSQQHQQQEEEEDRTSEEVEEQENKEEEEEEEEQQQEDEGKEEEKEGEEKEEEEEEEESICILCLIEALSPLDECPRVLQRLVQPALHRLAVRLHVAHVSLNRFKALARRQYLVATAKKREREKNEKMRRIK